MLYLEERQHQILPEEHQQEIHSLRFFGPGAERAAIEILAIIDWAAEFVKNEETPDMLGPNPGSGSPVTAAEDRALDTPGGFSRAPGDGRPIFGSAAGSSGRQITGRSTEG